MNTTYAVSSVRSQRRALIGWAIGIAGVVLMYSAFYPSIRSSAADLQAYVEKMPEAFKSIAGENFATPAGYLRGEVFSSLGILLLMIFTIGAAGRSIAGEEEGRTLDLLLSTPLRRRLILGDKALSIMLGTLALASVLFVVLAAIGPLFDLTVPIAQLASACLMLALVALAFGAIAFAVGASTGHRVLADTVAGGFAVFSLIVNALAPSVGALEPLRPFSPFRWYLQPDPVTGGLQGVNIAVLVAIVVVMYLIAWLRFERRDLAT